MIDRVFLLGNPNVGKSVVFSRLTGVHVIASNYPGTTVEISKGYLRIGEEKIEVIEEVTIKPFTSYLRPFLLDSILHDH